MSDNHSMTDAELDAVCNLAADALMHGAADYWSKARPDLTHRQDIDRRIRFAIAERIEPAIAEADFARQSIPAEGNARLVAFCNVLYRVGQEIAARVLSAEEPPHENFTLQ